MRASLEQQEPKMIVGGNADRGLVTVLHIAPTPFFSDRGGHMRIRGIIRGLKQKGLRNIVCTYHLGRNVDDIETVRILRIPGYTKQEAGPSPFKYLADILLFFKTCAVIARRRPHIIHGHLHEGALIGWAAKTCFFWRRMPLMFDVQGSLVGELEAHGYFRGSSLRQKVFWWIEYIIARLPDHFFCSSTNSMNILCSQFGVPPDHITLSNDGIDVCIADEKAVAVLRAQLALPDKPIAIYTGGLSPAKGLDSLCGIIMEARRRGLNCHFLIIGYPEQAMTEFSLKHALQSTCTVIGRVPYERLPEYLGLATVALEPKASAAGEASGKILNYMGAGLPVVCFDTVTNKELLGDDGYYARCGSIPEFVAQIEAVVNAPDEARRRSASIQASARARFSWDSSAEKAYSVYRTAVGF